VVARPVAEEALDPVDDAAVAVVDVAALEIERRVPERRRRQLDRDAAAVVRDLDRAVLEAREVDAGVDLADGDEEDALALELGRDEGSVLLDVDDHLEVAARGAEVAQVLDRLQHRRAGAVDRLLLERVGEVGDEVLDPADDEEAEEEDQAQRHRAGRDPVATGLVARLRRPRSWRGRQPHAARPPCRSAPR
jgi:hypothetical protein